MYHYVLLRTTTYYVYVLLRTTTYYYVLLRTTTYYYVLLRTTTYYYVLLRTTYTYYVYVLRIRTTYMYYVYVNVLRTTTYYYVLLRTTTYYYVLLRSTTYYVYVLLRTTYTSYTWLQMVRPPQPTHRGGAGTLCVYVVSLFAYTIKMTCRPCLDTYIHTYKQTINQYKQIVIIHKSIETYSYTFSWLQMVRPPQPTHRGGGGGNIMCTCSIFVCRHKNNDMSTLLGHVYTYIQTNHKSIQTNSYHT